MSEDEHDISWALELLSPNPDFPSSVQSRYKIEGIASFLGFIAPCIQNAANYRPIFRGIHWHICLAALGFSGGYLWRKGSRYIVLDTESTIRDYIQKHPEKFPPPLRRKFNDVVQPWVAVR